MARKRFGQHFLHEQGVIRRTLAAIHARLEDAVVEIGPGHGALTLPLLETVRDMTAIEVDRDLAARLQARTPARLEILQCDALAVDYAALAQRMGRSLRLVGNLPYNISSPLLFTLLASTAPIRDMHFMLQKEVVDRMVAAPGSRTYGRLSVAVAARARATALFDVGPGAFTPPPAVLSSVVRVVPAVPDFVIDDQVVFDRLVTAAFSKRRKTLRNALSGWLDAAAIRAAGIDPSLRPERLTPAQFATLANRARESRGL